MVCLGNICRSPIAEGVLRHKVKEHGLNWVVDSAGTESFHVGEAPHEFSQKVCIQNGVDISGQKARQFVREDLRRYDRIYAMAADVKDEIRKIAGPTADIGKVDLLLNEAVDNCNANVPDPWNKEEVEYTPVYEMIEKACEAIVKRYR
ncbi:MAG: low molecular weight phosphotyrosine protein phosphatase [Sphingobacteriales bacterium]|nr:MAG: low molecular weight phosphotyrosine protein phosphatase [Sphingobacteriales bacterium]